MTETAFATEAWRLVRQSQKLTLQDLLAVKPRPRPDSTMDALATTAVVFSIIFTTKTGSEEDDVLRKWLGRGGM